jgi:hypothetical protein
MTYQLWVDSGEWFNDVPCDDITIDEPGQGAMSDVLGFASKHMAELREQVRMLVLDGSHTSQFVSEDDTRLQHPLLLIAMTWW